MIKLIPNKGQRDKIEELYNQHIPGKNLQILDTGLVLHRRNASGSKIVGQVIRINNHVMAFVMNMTDHKMIFDGQLEPAETELELLSERVAKLERSIE